MKMREKKIKMKCLQKYRRVYPEKYKDDPELIKQDVMKSYMKKFTWIKKQHGGRVGQKVVR